QPHQALKRIPGSVCHSRLLRRRFLRIWKGLLGVVRMRITEGITRGLRVRFVRAVYEDNPTRGQRFPVLSLYSSIWRRDIPTRGQRLPLLSLYSSIKQS
ncbi:unnamed protein product, partial [Arctogadus glacialis]